MFLEKEHEQVEVDSVGSAKEALQLLKDTHYDTIISDYLMPSMNGLEFLRTIRNEGNTIPFIIFTGKGREEIAMKALNLGADYYIRKGGDPEAQYKLMVKTVFQIVKSKHEKEKYENLFHNLDEMVFFLDLQGNFLHVNDEAVRKLGYSKNELLSGNIEDFMAPTHAIKHREWMQTVKEQEAYTFKSKHVTNQGKKIPVEVRATLCTLQGRHIILCISRDISKQAEMEKQLKELNSLFQSLQKIVR